MREPNGDEEGKNYWFFFRRRPDKALLTLLFFLQAKNDPKLHSRSRFNFDTQAVDLDREHRLQLVDFASQQLSKTR